MRFFYEAVRQINQLNNDSVKVEDAAKEADGEKGGPGEDEGPGDTDGAPPGQPGGYMWLDAVRAVSEYTRYDWEKIFRMSAMEFFTFLAYVNFDKRREERRIKAIGRKKG